MSWIDTYPYQGTEPQTRSIGMLFLYLAILGYEIVIRPFIKWVADWIAICQLRMHRHKIR